jgi:CBS domain containing-hemolysin-like protein
MIFWAVNPMPEAVDYAGAWLGLLWFAALLAGNGFFVAAEFALIAARRAQIEPRAEAGSRPARITIKAMERVSVMLATSQIGVTLCSLAILVIAEPAIHTLIFSSLLFLGTATAEGVTFAVALVLVSSLHVLLGELIPKQLSFAVPERMALVLVPLLYGVALVLRPIVVSLNFLANLALKAVGIKPRDSANTAYTIDQVEDIVEHSTREGVLSDTSGAISNTFEFTEKQVGDIVVPLGNVIGFELSVTPKAVEAAVTKHGFSRYTLSDIDGALAGYLHIKDVLDLEDHEFEQPFPAKRVRSLHVVALDTELEDALAGMRKANAHLAKAVNPDGSVAGVIFLEDILEELVGEVQDATRRTSR